MREVERKDGKMKFWKDNRLDQEFDVPVDVLAVRFCMDLLADGRPAGEALDMPLERKMRDWLASDQGARATWTDEHGEESFDALFDLVYVKLFPARR